MGFKASMNRQPFLFNSNVNSMKTIFTFFIALFSGIFAFASDIRMSSLSITVPNSSVKVEVDERTYYASQGEVFLQDIQPGIHKVVLYRETVRQYGWKKRTAREIILQKTIQLKPATHLMMDVDRYARVSITEEQLYRRNGNWGSSDGWGNDRADRRDNDGRRDDGYGRDRGRSPSVYTRAISNEQFDRAVEMIQRERYENNRMKSTEQLIRGNFLTTRQVSSLMDLFFSDDNKLEVAKLAYEKVIDEEKYEELADQFRTQTAKNAFYYFLRNNY